MSRRRCSDRKHAWAAMMVVVATGCGGAMSARASETAAAGPAATGGAGGFAAYAPPPPASPEPAAADAPVAEVRATSLETYSMRRRSAAADDEAFRAEVGGESDGDGAEDAAPPERPPATRQVVVAQATTPAQPAGGGTGGQARAQTATDAVDPNGPLLIYEAELDLAVNEIRQRQAEAIALVREMRGFIARQDDTSIVLRVPAARFNEALAALERIGDVLHRTVQSHDVTEEFHDTEIRLRNALAIRDRLQQLLERAGNVQDSLVVERELERITMSIEQMRGRLRFLSDRIAFSTITIRFSGRPTESLGPASGQFRLPFPWLDQLGLSNLLDLSAAE